MNRAFASSRTIEPGRAIALARRLAVACAMLAAILPALVMHHTPAAAQAAPGFEVACCLSQGAQAGHGQTGHARAGSCSLIGPCLAILAGAVQPPVASGTLVRIPTVRDHATGIASHPPMRPPISPV